MRMILGLDAPDRRHGRPSTAGPTPTLAAPLREVGALLEAKAVHTSRSALQPPACARGHPRHPAPPGRRGDRPGRAARTSPASGPAASPSAWASGSGIASALLGDPPTLILDEPVNGLDPEGIRWIRDLLKGLAAEGRTVFVSSHLMSEMALTAEHVIVVGRGRLIADTLGRAELIAQALGQRRAGAQPRGRRSCARRWPARTSPSPAPSDDVLRGDRADRRADRRHRPRPAASPCTSSPRSRPRSRRRSWTMTRDDVEYHGHLATERDRAGRGARHERAPTATGRPRRDRAASGSRPAAGRHVGVDQAASRCARAGSPWPPPSSAMVGLGVLISLRHQQPLGAHAARGAAATSTPSTAAWPASTSPSSPSASSACWSSPVSTPPA